MIIIMYIFNLYLIFQRIQRHAIITFQLNEIIIQSNINIEYYILN